MKVKTNPVLFIYYNPEESCLTILDPYAKRHFVLQNQSLIRLFAYAKKEKSIAQLIDFLNEQFEKPSKSKARKIICDLLKKKIFVGKDDLIYIRKLQHERKEWLNHNWLSAFYYHLLSRDYPFLDYSKREHSIEDFKLMESYSNRWLPPSNYKDYPKRKKYKFILDKDLLVKLIYPVSVINYSKKKLDVANLSLLLYLTFGQTGFLTFPILGKGLLKTSPSGGARHPTEAYLILLKEVGFPKGIYHYSVRSNAIELIRPLKGSSKINEIFFQLNLYPSSRPKAIIVLTSLVERAMWRYREPRSFRVIFFDIGHLIATIRVVAASLGLHIIIGDGFNDAEVKKILGLRAFDEQPLNFIALL